MKHQLILTGLLMMAAPQLMAQNYFEDDIYYNPAKDKTSAVEKQQKSKSKKKQSNYIANYADIDVDAYNRRGQMYYPTPVDTIGQKVENDEDFVYTQEIQKYYDPTIVVDNADVLADVLANSYGNVDIVINSNGNPVFAPYYAYYSWPYYSNWGISVSPWGWNVGFYDPWYAWNWGPSWTWGPAWGWGPSWGWGPAWGWGHPVRPAHPVANWRPNGNRPVGGNAGWANGHRPGNRAPVGGGVSRPASATRPGTHAGVVNNNGRWEYNTNRGNRTPVGGGTYTPGSTTGNKYNGVVTNGSQNGNNGAVRTNRGSRTSNNTSTTTNSYNSNNNRSYNYNSGSRNSNSTRSYGSGRSYGGGSRGTVGGGSRGGRGGRR